MPPVVPSSVALWLSSGLAIASMVVGLLVSYAVPSVPPSFAVVATAATTYALTARGDLDDEEYAGAVAALGLPMVFELLTLVGYYATLALQLRVFRVAAPDG